MTQENDMLEYRDKITGAFNDGTFSFEHLKKSDDAVYDYELNKVNKLIQKIKPMTKNINLSLFNEFFGSLPVGYAKYLINLKNAEESKESVTEAENIISDLKDRIKKMNEKEKKKNADETLNIIEKNS